MIGLSRSAMHAPAADLAALLGSGVFCDLPGRALLVIEHNRLPRRQRLQRRRRGDDGRLSRRVRYDDERQHAGTGNAGDDRPCHIQSPSIYDIANIMSGNRETHKRHPPKGVSSTKCRAGGSPRRSAKKGMGRRQLDEMGMSGCSACPIVSGFPAFPDRQERLPTWLPRRIIRPDGIRSTFDDHHRTPEYEQKIDRFMNPAPCAMTRLV